MSLEKWRLTLVVAVALAAVVATFEAFAPRLELLDGVAPPVGSWFALPGRPTAAYGVSSVVRGGNLAAAGILVGDVVVPDDSFAARWLWRPGDLVPVTVLRAGVAHREIIAASHRPLVVDAASWIIRIGRLTLQLSMLALALVIVWQLADARWVRWLCAFLVCFGFAPWQVDSVEYYGAWRLFAAAFEDGIIQAGICCAMMFAATILGDPVSGLRAWMVRVTPIVFAALECAIVGLTFDLRPVYVTFPLRLLQLCCIVAIVASLAVAAEESHGQDRQRLRYLTWTFGLGFSGFFASVIALWHFGNGWGTNYQIWSLPRLTLLAVPIGFAYGLLSHRVVSTSFIASRTIVYGAITGSLVPVFAVAEWTATNVFSNSQSKSAFFVALTVLITTSFKGVHKRIDDLVDKWLFKKQHNAEKTIAKFAKEVSHLHDAPLLIERTVAILDENVGAASSAVYVHAEPEIMGDRNVTADYLRINFAGNPPPESIPESDALVLALKADGEASECDVAGKGGHAFPMLSRGHLVGILVLGAKRDGEILSPDEIKQLTELAQAVAAALEAIRIDDLESKLASAQAGRAELQRLLTDLVRPADASQTVIN